MPSDFFKHQIFLKLSRFQVTYSKKVLEVNKETVFLLGGGKDRWVWITCMVRYLYLSSNPHPQSSPLHHSHRRIHNNPCRRPGTSSRRHYRRALRTHKLKQGTRYVIKLAANSRKRHKQVRLNIKYD